MTFLKQVVTVLLSVTMLVNGFTVYAQEAEGNGEVTSSILRSDEFDALYAMGMLGEEFAALGEKEPVTRAQFLDSLFNIAGYDLMVCNPQDMPFIDVSIESPYRDVIYTLYKMNIVNGTSENTFSPDEYINYVQAVKIILNVCGYGEFTIAKYGNNLNSYLAMSQYLKIATGFVIGDKEAPLEAGKAVKLLYNAARTKVMEPTSFKGEDSVYYEALGSEELISLRNDIYYNEGILSSDGVVSLNSNHVKEFYATIGKNEYSVGELDLTQMLGSYVKYFYQKVNGYKTLKWVGLDNAKNNILQIDSYDLETDDSRYTLQCIVYNKDKRKTLAKISPYATIIYNKSLYNDAGVEQIKPGMGSIKLIDNDNDQTYDIVIVEEQENVFVTSVISAVGLIGNKYGPTVDLTEYEYVQIYKDGKKCEKEDIKINSVISVVRDRNKNFIFLYLSDSNMQSSLVSTWEENGDTFYELENGTYKLSSSYVNRDTTKYLKIDPVLGRTYNFYFDKDGRIAEIEEVANGEIDYAYLINIFQDNSLGAEEDSVILELLLRDGSVVKSSTKKRLTLNGTPKKKGIDIYNTQSIWTDGVLGGTVKEQVVRVAFDSEGLVKEFETAVDNTGDPYGYDPENFSLDFSGTEGVTSRNGILLFNKYVLDGSVTVFVKYTDSNIGDTYGIITGNSMPQGSRALRLYDISADQRISVATVVLGQGATLSYEFLVSDVFRKSVDGEFVDCIGGYYGGTYLEYAGLYEDSIPADIKRGDVVDITLYDQRIISLKKFISLADRPSPFGSGTYLSTYRMFSHVYTASNVGITMIAPSGFASTYGKILPVHFNKGYTIPVTIYDVANDEIYKGAVGDLTATTQPYKNGDLVIDDNTVMAIVQCSNNQLKDIIYVKY